MVDLSKIEELIAAHAATWVALEAVCGATDGASRDDAEEAQAKASDATFDALWNIIEHPYTSIDELKRGMAYLAEHHRSTGDGDPDEWFQGFVEHLTGISMEEQP